MVDLEVLRSVVDLVEAHNNGVLEQHGEFLDDRPTYMRRQALIPRQLLQEEQDAERGLRHPLKVNQRSLDELLDRRALLFALLSRARFELLRRRRLALQQRRPLLHLHPLRALFAQVLI